MQYHTLNEQTARQLRMERVYALEADHYRALLQAEETGDPDGRLAADMESLEGRIALHVGVLFPPGPDGSDTDSDGGGDEPGPDGTPPPVPALTDDAAADPEPGRDDEPVPATAGVGAGHD